MKKTEWNAKPRTILSHPWTGQWEVGYRGTASCQHTEQPCSCRVGGGEEETAGEETDGKA